MPKFMHQEFNKIVVATGDKNDINIKMWWAKRKNTIKYGERT